MIKYTWDCKTVEVRPLENSETDVVYNVNWKVTGTSDILDSDGTAYSAIAIGEQILTYNLEGTFIPFEDLTNEIVFEWTQAAMGEEQVANIEASIASQIESLIHPTSVTLTIGETQPPAE